MSFRKLPPERVEAPIERPSEQQLNKVWLAPVSKRSVPWQRPPAQRLEQEQPSAKASARQNQCSDRRSTEPVQKQVEHSAAPRSEPLAHKPEQAMQERGVPDQRTAYPSKS